MRDINLLPGLGNVANKRKVSLAKYLIVLCFVVIIAGWLGYEGYILNPQMASMDEQLSNTMAKIKEYSKATETKNAYQKATTHLTNIKAVLESMDKQELLNTKVIDTLASVTPPDVFAMSYSATDNRSIQLLMRAKDEASIASFVYDLKHVEMFQDVVIAGFSRNEATNGQLQDLSFAVSLTVKENE